MRHLGIEVDVREYQARRCAAGLRTRPNRAGAIARKSAGDWRCCNEWPAQGLAEVSRLERYARITPDNFGAVQSFAKYLNLLAGGLGLPAMAPYPTDSGGDFGFN